LKSSESTFLGQFFDEAENLFGHASLDRNAGVQIPFQDLTSILEHMDVPAVVAYPSHKDISASPDSTHK
jgi:hypothetical protein